ASDAAREAHRRHARRTRQRYGPSGSSVRAGLHRGWNALRLQRKAQGSVRRGGQPVSQRTNSKGAVRGATVGVKAALTPGHKLIDVLDSFVKTALANDPVLLAARDTVKRVQLLNGRPTAKTSAPAPASTNASGTAVAATPATTAGTTVTTATTSATSSAHAPTPTAGTASATAPTTAPS